MASAFRLDRMLTLGLVHPVIQMLRDGRKAGIPILMYHGIRNCSGCRERFQETHTSPAAFKEQMEFLWRQGYRTLAIGDVLQHMTEERLTEKAVAITFDDGYEDFYTNAFPVLADLGFRATVFIVSNFVGKSIKAPERERFMTWPQVRDIHEAGMEIGSHSANHRVLRHQSSSEIDCELSASKDVIEEKVGAPVDSFAFPYAFPEHDQRYAQNMRARLNAFGYRTAVTTVIGRATRASDPLLLPRLSINLYDDLGFFAAKMMGAYDWMHTVQLARKRVEWRRRSGSAWQVATGSQF